MNTAKRGTPLGLRLLLVALGVVAMTACERRLDNTKAPKQQVSSTTVTTTTNVPSSGNLIGTPPGAPTTPEGTTETTPVPPEKQLTGTRTTVASAPQQQELTKTEESSQMPLPGQNDHSNLAPDASQRAAPSQAATQ
jgi:hypothetical protein